MCAGADACVCLPRPTPNRAIGPFKPSGRASNRRASWRNRCRIKWARTPTRISAADLAADACTRFPPARLHARSGPKEQCNKYGLRPLPVSRAAISGMRCPRVPEAVRRNIHDRHTPVLGRPAGHPAAGAPPQRQSDSSSDEPAATALVSEPARLRARARTQRPATAPAALRSTCGWCRAAPAAAAGPAASGQRRRGSTSTTHRGCRG